MEKKKKLSTEILNKIAVVKKQVINTLSGDASDLRDALLALFDALENQEEEFDINQFKSEIEKVIAEYSDVPEATANAIAKATENIIARVYDRIGIATASAPLSAAIKNQIASAILRAHDKADAQNKVNAVLTKNDITGVTYEGLVDYVVDWKIEDLNPLFGKLHRTFINTFYYGEINASNYGESAKGWDPSQVSEKVIQDLQAKGKKIDTQYIYKRQRIGFKDLDAIEAAGQTSQFLAAMAKELDLMIVNAIIQCILAGDIANAGQPDEITSFEKLGWDTSLNAYTSDTWTTVVEANDGGLASYISSVNPATTASTILATFRYVRDKIHNPYGKEVVACMTRDTLTLMSARVMAAGGDLVFRTKEEIAAELGVDEIFLVDYLRTWGNSDSTIPQAVFFIPDGYWYKEDKVLDITYPKYEQNAMNYQKERNAGGAAHDILSAAVYYKK